MITGQIDSSLRAFVTLEAVTSDDSTQSLTAIIDTGFDGQLTLPLEQIQKLDLPQIGTREIDLGDDSTATTEVYLGAVLWDGEPRPVMVLRAGQTPPVGMELMEHFRLLMNVHAGGTFELVKLP
jgi:predicted aspartyl protease